MEFAYLGLLGFIHSNVRKDDVFLVPRAQDLLKLWKTIPTDREFTALPQMRLAAEIQLERKDFSLSALKFIQLILLAKNRQ